MVHQSVKEGEGCQFEGQSTEDVDLYINKLLPSDLIIQPAQQFLHLQVALTLEFAN